MISTWFHGHTTLTCFGVGVQEGDEEGPAAASEVRWSHSPRIWAAANCEFSRYRLTGGPCHVGPGWQWHWHHREITRSMATRLRGSIRFSENIILYICPSQLFLNCEMCVDCDNFAFPLCFSFTNNFIEKCFYKTNISSHLRILFGQFQ